MLLTITTTNQPLDDLTYLLHKHPDKIQHFSVSNGNVHFFYPEITAEKISATMLLEIDPIGLVRNSKDKPDAFVLENYVNDRPYIAGSMMSHAISEVLGTALNGNCKNRPDAVDKKMPFEITVAVEKPKVEKI